MNATKGLHTVKLTQIGTGNLMPHSVDCVDSSTDFSSTLLYSPPTWLTVAGWAVGATANSSTGNSATGALAWMYDNGGCDRFSSVIDAAMMDLYSLGFNVVPTYVKQRWNPISFTSVGDPLHPNDAGHFHIYIHIIKIKL